MIGRLACPMTPPLFVDVVVQRWITDSQGERMYKCPKTMGLMAVFCLVLVGDSAM